MTPRAAPAAHPTEAKAIIAERHTATDEVRRRSRSRLGDPAAPPRHRSGTWWLRRSR